MLTRVSQEKDGGWLWTGWTKWLGTELQPHSLLHLQSKGRGEIDWTTSGQWFDQPYLHNEVTTKALTKEVQGLLGWWADPHARSMVLCNSRQTELQCLGPFWTSPDTLLPLFIFYYHTLYNKLINISKHFPEFCKGCLSKLEPEEGLMRTPNLQPVGQKHNLGLEASICSGGSFGDWALL